MRTQYLPTFKPSAIRSSALIGTGLVTASLLFSAAADAHVRVLPDTATPGSYPTLMVRVPTESDTASTTKVELDLPTDHPFGSVSYAPVSGWNVQVTTTKLAHPVTTDDGTINEAPTKIVWTAYSNAAIKPGQFQTFPIVVGPVPKTGSVSFSAKQTYSDGKVVNWNEKAEPGKSEPDNPAPLLYINDKAPDAAPSAGGSSNTSNANASAENTSESSDSSDSGAVWFGVAGIVLGAAALVTAIWAGTKRK